MSIKPAQSSATSLIQSEERIKVSKSPKTTTDAPITSDAPINSEDAVTVSLGKSQREENSSPPNSYGAQRGRGATNFKKIDTDGNGVVSKEELLAAQEVRQSEGKNTKFIDRALANFDALTESSGSEGITKKEFYKPYTPETDPTPITDPTVVSEEPTDLPSLVDPVAITDTTTPIETETLPLVVETLPSETVLLTNLLLNS